GAPRPHAHARDASAEFDSGEDELSVLQPEPGRSRVGSGSTRAQPGGVRPRRLSGSAIGAGHPTARSKLAPLPLAEPRESSSAGWPCGPHKSMKVSNFHRSALLL